MYVRKVILEIISVSLMFENWFDTQSLKMFTLNLQVVGTNIVVAATAKSADAAAATEVIDHGC